MSDQNSTQTLEHQQVTMVTENQDVKEDALVGASDLPLTTLDRFSMANQHLDAVQLLQNPVLLGNFTWSISDTPGTVLQHFDVPEVFSAFDSFQRQILGIYAFFKPELEFIIKLTASPYHVGKLIAFYDPFQQMLAAANPLNQAKFVNRISATGQPHMFLDAANANSGTLCVPFQHPQAYLTTNSAEGLDVMGRLRIMVFNQLQVVAPTTNTVDFQVFIRCSNVELRVPIAPHAPQIPVFHAEIGFGGLERGIGNAAQGVVGTIWNVVTGNWSGALSSAGRGIMGTGQILSGAGLDKPADPLVATRNTIAPVAPLAHGSGVDASTRLAITPMGGYLEDMQASVEPTNHACSQIAQKKMFVDTFSWSVNDPPNKILYNVPVLPSYASYGGTSSGFAWVFPTFLSYISACFAQWRGSISYRFDVVAGPAHNGLLGVFFVPNQTKGEIPAALQQMTNMPMATLEITQSNRTLTVTVPYVSSTERKLWVEWASLPNRDMLLDNEMLGTLQVRVMNKLTCPSILPQQIDINVFIGGGSDIEFHAPIKRPQTSFKLPPAPAFVAEMDVPLPTGSSADPAPIYLGKNGGPVASTSPYNEQSDDVRDLMRRYSFIGDHRLDMTLKPGSVNGLRYEGKTEFKVHPQLDVVYPSAETPHTAVGGFGTNLFMHYFSRLFAMWSGSIRYKIVPYVSRTQPLLGIGIFDITQDYFTESPLSVIIPEKARTTAPSHVTNFSQQSALELECPFYSVYGKLLTETTLTRLFPQLDTSGLLRLQFETDNLANFAKDVSGNQNIAFDLYAAAGDDFRLTYLVSPPSYYTAVEAVRPPVFLAEMDTVGVGLGTVKYDIIQDDSHEGLNLTEYHVFNVTCPTTAGNYIDVECSVIGGSVTQTDARTVQIGSTFTGPMNMKIKVLTNPVIPGVYKQRTRIHYTDVFGFERHFDFVLEFTFIVQALPTVTTVDISKH